MRRRFGGLYSPSVLIFDLLLTAVSPYLARLARLHLPWGVERYAPWQRKRFAVPTGITGWWQIMGRSERMTSTIYRTTPSFWISRHSGGPSGW